jgi:hypothetical protein
MGIFSCGLPPEEYISELCLCTATTFLVPCALKLLELDAHPSHPAFGFVFTIISK